MRKPALYFASLLGLLLAHCGPDKLAGGAGAGNPPLADVTLSFLASSTADAGLPKAAAQGGSPASGPGLAKATGGLTRNADGTFTVRDSSGAGIVLTAIEVGVRRIDFELPEGIDCEHATGTSCDSSEVSVRGAFIMDLMTGESVPSLGTFRLPEGLYKRVRLRLEGNDGGSSGESHKDGADGSASGPNMVIKGRTDSARGPVRVFALKLNLSEGLEFEKPEGFRIAADSLNSVLMQLAVDGWLRGIDLMGCLDPVLVPADGSGVQNLEGDDFCGGNGLRLRRNIEGSGEIDKGEDDHP
ncbi:MAG: hypothetical protein JWP91_567 [Fibrobacteres bacterium]|nr:hypothetical protein [Fibrobacterota bacterium]